MSEEMGSVTEPTSAEPEPTPADQEPTEEVDAAAGGRCSAPAAAEMVLCVESRAGLSTSGGSDADRSTFVLARYPDDGSGGIGRRWVVQSSVREAGSDRWFTNGSEIKSRGRAHRTLESRLLLGLWVEQISTDRMDVAAALIYDRALTDGERAEIERHLDETFLRAAGPARTGRRSSPSAAPGDATTSVEEQHG